MKKNSQLYIFLLFFTCQFLISFESYPREYYYELNTIPFKGELANFSGQCMLQDSEGFMWFGSVDGLYRYDGSTFKVFRNELYDSTTLSYNMVHDVLEDSRGDIWVATEAGLNRFHKKTETFTRYYHIPKNPKSILVNEISSLAEDQNGTLWIGTFEGFCKFNRKDETFTNYKISKWYPGHPVYIGALSCKERGFLWISSIGSIYRFNIAAESLEYTGEFKFPVSFDAMENYKVDYWNHNLTQLNTPVAPAAFINPATKKPLKEDEIRHVYMDELNNIWIRTNEGIQGYDQQLNVIYAKTHLQPYSASGGYDFTQSLFEDHNGSIWFFTLNGIAQVIRKNKYFEVHDPDRDERDDVFCLTTGDQDDVWVGTDIGVYKLDRVNDRFSQIFGSDYEAQGKGDRVKSIYYDNKKVLWIGMAYIGIFAMDTSGTIKRYFKPNWIDWEKNPQNSRFLSINTIVEDHEGRIWFCSFRSALCFFDRMNQRMVFLSDSANGKNQLLNRIISIYEREPGTYYAVGKDIIYKLKSPFIMINDSVALPNEIIPCKAYDEKGQEILLKGNFLCFSRSGDIWMTSLKNGLFRMLPYPKGGDTIFTVKKYTVKDGLPDNSVTSIVEDEKGNIWLGTHGGLSKFSYITESFTNFSIRHGLPSNRNNNNSMLYKNGEIYFGSEGLVIFHPDSLQSNMNVEPVKITDFKIDSKPIKPGIHSPLQVSPLYTDSVKLKYNQHNLSFSYAMLSYVNPELNQYKYLLEGFHEDWVYAGNRTEVDFTNLNPREYTFRVIAANEEGVWNNTGDSIHIAIQHPPWFTGYAYLAYVVFLSAIGFWIYRFQMNRMSLKRTIEREHLELEKVNELDRMKSRFFTNVSHEFRTPLTLIRGPIEDLKKQKSKNVTLKRDLLDIMHRNTIRLQNLINQLLDISKMETGKLKLQVSKGNINVLLRTIIQSFLSLADSKAIDYRYRLPNLDKTVWFDSDKVEKILTNLISNAFKFTPLNGRIEINSDFNLKSGTEIPDFLNLSVSDSGIGIPKDKLEKIFDRFYQVSDTNNQIAEGTGIGLALTKELVELYRGNICVESEPEEGTVFRIKLPVARGLFSESEIVKSSQVNSMEQLTGMPVFEQESEVIHPKFALMHNEKSLILIVEDNLDLSAYITGILENDFQIISAENGQTGFESAMDSVPDLIISDLMMSVMDGMEMCSRLKENEMTSHIPVIMLTAKADRDSKLEGLQTGADDYVVKPFDAEELKVRVKNLIDQRNKLREKFGNDILASKQIRDVKEIEDPIIKKLFDFIEKHYTDSDFKVDEIGAKLNMSRSQFFRKISALTGETPNEILRLYRIKKAAQLLRTNGENIAGIMSEVGFRSTSHFANSFRKYFGQSPSEYRKSFKQKT